MKALLYTTPGCHLCEEAHRLLLDLQGEGMKIRIETVDIAGADALMQDYGLRIPVIAAGQDEIGWPFSLDDLRAFLRSMSGEAEK